MAKRALILGGGVSGCTISHLLGQKGWERTIVDKENGLGGGLRTLYYGGHPYTNGPRLYYGYSDKIHSWIQQFIELRDLPLELWSYVETEHRFFNYPIHEDDIPLMSKASQIYAELEKSNGKTGKQYANFEEYWRGEVGPTLYDMFVAHYSRKMWLINSNTELDTFHWSAKDRPINTGDRLAYKGSYMAYPVGDAGYDPLFAKLAEGTRLVLGRTVEHVDFDRKAVVLDDGTRLEGDVIISTIPIEELCEYSQGELPYAGRKFIPFVLPIKQIFPGRVRFLHYTQDEPYTRIVEYKKLTHHESDDTLLVMELPAREGKLYPYMIKKYLDRATSYRTSLPDDIYSCGRLGTYTYSTIEQSISQAFGVFRKVTGTSEGGIENEFFAIGDVSLIKERQVAQSS